MCASEERHVSVDKAVDCIGLGRNALRALPPDWDFQVRLDALENAVAQDKRDGIRPMCIVGVFGTTNTGLDRANLNNGWTGQRQAMDQR